MKRLCFDTESNYFMRPGTGVGTPEAHREHWRGRNLRFDCGVVFDEETGHYHEFGNNRAFELLELLASADELITHSGLRVDLIVLDHACGEDRVAPLWQIEHHDLMEICSMTSLDDLARQFIPDQSQLMHKEYKLRIEPLDIECKLKNWSDEKNFIATKIAKARYDVERTYAVFQEICRRRALQSVVHQIPNI